MRELPFDAELMRTLAASRSEALTGFFQLFTFLGEVEGYVLLVTLIHVAFDKRLAFRLSVVALVTMSLNHLLKLLIANPRPFVVDGTYTAQWAVSAERAAELATEFSTPSGHAMAGGAFYAYLLASVESRPLRAACVALILLTGLSRPYLGVHYLEDVLLGWLLGGAIACALIRAGGPIARLWGGIAHAQQIALVLAATASIWAATLWLGGPDVATAPLAILGYTGFLLGLVVAFPLEERALDFEPRSGSLGGKLLRFAVSVSLVLGTLAGFDAAFAAVAPDESGLGYALRYLRYALAGLAGLLVAPALFLATGLAEPSEASGVRPS